MSPLISYFSVSPGLRRLADDHPKSKGKDGKVLFTHICTVPGCGAFFKMSRTKEEKRWQVSKPALEHFRKIHPDSVQGKEFHQKDKFKQVSVSCFRLLLLLLFFFVKK
jgi:hypothetical protein